jgi:hypothetical protein
MSYPTIVIAKKEQQVKKLTETTSKGHLTMDLACLSLRPYQWPKSMSVETTQHLDHTHSEAITKVLQSIQSDRLKMLVKDLSDYKVDYSEENLIIYCKETLKTICPNVFQHEDVVDRLTEGLSGHPTIGNQSFYQAPAYSYTSYLIKSFVMSP